MKITTPVMIWVELSLNTGVFSMISDSRKIKRNIMLPKHRNFNFSGLLINPKEIVRRKDVIKNYGQRKRIPMIMRTKKTDTS